VAQVAGRLIVEDRAPTIPVVQVVCVVETGLIQEQAEEIADVEFLHAEK
jgi:hypothetical protein